MKNQFKVQEEADANRRGIPCGYPNETANINHRAPTRDAPTTNNPHGAMKSVSLCAKKNI